MGHKNHPAWLVVLAVFVIAGPIGCADREEPTNIPIQAHPDGWNDPADADFHGNYIAAIVQANEDVEEEQRRSGVEGCRSCHGADLGKQLGEQCYACHAQGEVEKGGHPGPNVFLVPSQEGFHGNAVIEAQGFEPCQNCHGVEFRGGWTEVDCFDCHPGPSGHPEPNVWVAPQNPGYHGAVIIERESTERCAECHGVDYLGGWSEASCTVCHAGGRSGHPFEFGDDLDEPSDLTAEQIAIHSSFLAARGPGDCAECHGEQGNGGWTGVACSDCHQGNQSRSGGLSGHPASSIWIPETIGGEPNPDFHGAQDFDDCRPCHGEDLLGGPFLSPEYPRLSCNACHGWPLVR